MATKAAEKAKEVDKTAKQKPETPAPVPVRSWERELEHFFDDFPRLTWPRWLRTATPAVDVLEDKDQVVVKAEIPGMSKDDIEVSVSDHTLIIKGEKRREKEVKEANYYRTEREFGSVFRSLSLPAEVTAEGANATFKDGVLEIRLPKTDQAKRKSVKLHVQ